MARVRLVCSGMRQAGVQGWFASKLEGDSWGSSQLPVFLVESQGASFCKAPTFSQEIRELESVGLMSSTHCIVRSEE